MQVIFFKSSLRSQPSVMRSIDNFSLFATVLLQYRRAILRAPGFVVRSDVTDSAEAHSKVHACPPVVDSHGLSLNVIASKAIIVIASGSDGRAGGWTGMLLVPTK